MRLASYIIQHDMGFAPNPFHGFCSLADCKPKIRKYLNVGDYVVGTGTAGRNLRGHLVYVMKVSSVISFDDYWNTPKYARKKALMNGSLVQRYGDNIYHRDPKTRAWIQEDSFHSFEDGVTNHQNLKRDTDTTDRVLIGEQFMYWGGDGPKIPGRFSNFIHPGVGHKYIRDETKILNFLAWANSQGPCGVIGEPCEWKYSVVV